jgi:putative salt-induced outer membrane protein YdiY
MHDRIQATLTAIPLVLAAALANAQPPAPAASPTPTPGWHGNLGAGLAATHGNRDTQSYSLSALVSYDPLRRDVLRFDALYLNAETDGSINVDKSALGARGERRFGDRAFVFAESRYQRDRFKALSYLISPALGAGLKLVTTDRLALSADTGVGLAFEKLHDRDATTSGALRSGETLAIKLSPSATFNQMAAALWKMSDFGDAFYHLEAGLTLSIVRRAELKLQALTDWKTRPARPGLEKRDDALMTAVVFKF